MVVLLDIATLRCLKENIMFLMQVMVDFDSKLKYTDNKSHNLVNPHQN